MRVLCFERRLFRGCLHLAVLLSQERKTKKKSTHRMPAVKVGRTLKIPCKNENTYAKHTSDLGVKELIMTVLDLIAVLDSCSWCDLRAAVFKYGYCVVVIGVACSPHWRETKEGIAIGGPHSVGYDVDYRPLAEYVKPRSVIEEYSR